MFQNQVVGASTPVTIVQPRDLHVVYEIDCDGTFRERGWVEELGSNQYRIKEFPVSERLNIDDVVSLKEARGQKIVKDVIKKVFEKKTQVCVNGTLKKRDRLADELVRRGCKVLITSDGLFVAHSRRISPKTVAKQLSIVVYIGKKCRSEDISSKLKAGDWVKKFAENADLDYVDDALAQAKQHCSFVMLPTDGDIPDCCRSQLAVNVARNAQLFRAKQLLVLQSLVVQSDRDGHFICSTCERFMWASISKDYLHFSMNHVNQKGDCWFELDDKV